MITLALLRHAKAVQDDGAGDHARRLSPRGRDDAAAAGDWLRRTVSGPLLVLASDARRTCETAELAFPPPRHAVEIRLEPDLYGASADALLERLRALDAASLAVIVGHNPGIGELARQLAGAGDEAARARLHAGYPTSSCAVLQFDGMWSEVGPGRCRLTALLVRDRDG